MAKKAERKDETDRAADLLERLLTDKEFRKSFRRSPSSAAKKFGLDDLAEELSGQGKAMYTLEIRESRSSLAGVMMAAAAEGVDASDLADQVGGAAGPDSQAAVAFNKALSRTTLQAVPGPDGLGGNGAAVESVVPSGDGAAAAESAIPSGDGAAAVEAPSVPGDGAVEGVSAPPVETPEVPAGDGAVESVSAGDQAVEGVVPSAPVGGVVSAPAAGAGFVQAPASPVPEPGVGPATAREDDVFSAADQALQEKAQRAAGGARGTLGLQAVQQPQGAAAVAQPAAAAADAVGLAPQPAAGGIVAPIDPADMNNTNAGGELHGSEFDAQDAEGAPDVNGVRHHAGYDLFGRPGAEIRSPVGGTIVEVKPSVGTSGQIFGGVVKVQGADGKVWVFRHVDPGSVSVGQQVTAGTPIAGISPWDGGPTHTHVEVWKTLDGGYRYENMEDPLQYFQQAYQGPQAGAAAGAVAEQTAGAPGGGAAGAVVEGVAPVAPGDVNQALVQQVLNDPKIHLDSDAQADLRSGEIDPRVPALLETLSKKGHDIELSVIKTGHSTLTAGGSVSNHTVGRGFDIATVDGERVEPGSIASRDLAEALANVDPSIRPTEIGSPWPISGEGFFSDSNHQDHIHVAWDDPAPAGWQPPAGVLDAPAATPGAVAGAVPAAAAVPGAAGVVPAEPGAGAATGRSDDVFAAAEEKLAQKQEKAAAGGRQTLGLQAVQDQPQSAAGAQQVAAVAEPVPAGTGATMGDFLPDGSDTYPGDNASKEEIAAWMGRQAHKAGLPAELPVMASLVESGLSNVDHGDADSLGYFQMRTSIWDRGEYAGFANDPQKQLKWFIDNALEVKRQRIAEGRQAELQDPSKFGEWIADVERPAEQYRGRYQERLQEAAQLLHDNGATTTPAEAALATPSPDPSAVVPPSATAPPMTIAPQRAGGVMGDAVAATAPVPSGAGLETMTIDGIQATGSPAALKALQTAFSFKGTPYYWGGNDPKTGFDCSGITQYAYKEAGFDISRVTYTQVNDGVAVEPRVENLQAGDLLFFRDSSGDNHHMAMYIGNGQFIHAPHTGDVVKVSSLNEPYYKEQFFAARRIAPADPSAAPPVVAAPQPVVAAAAAAQPAVATPVEEAAVSGSGGRQDDVFQAAEEVVAKKAQAKASIRATVQFMQAIPQQPAAPAAGVVAPGQPAQVLQAVPSQGPQPAAAAGTVDPSMMQSPVGASGVAGGYPGDNAPKEQIAAWMAGRAKALGLPPELPVMASLVESGLSNVDHGDADSLGYFQMRTSIWDQGEYAGFAQNPELQLKWFLDHAVAVKQRREELGYTAFENDPNKWGDWVADVERPAEQYRGRYQLRLEEARALLAQAGVQ